MFCITETKVIDHAVQLTLSLSKLQAELINAENGTLQSGVEIPANEIRATGLHPQVFWWWWWWCLRKQKLYIQCTIQQW